MKTLFAEKQTGFFILFFPGDEQVQKPKEIHSAKQETKAKLMKPSGDGWIRQLIDQHGDKSVWTVDWWEGYLPRSRRLQTYETAKKLARLHNGRISLDVDASLKPVPSSSSSCLEGGAPRRFPEAGH